MSARDLAKSHRPHVRKPELSPVVIEDLVIHGVVMTEFVHVVPRVEIEAALSLKSRGGLRSWPETILWLALTPIEEAFWPPYLSRRCCTPP